MRVLDAVIGLAIVPGRKGDMYTIQLGCGKRRRSKERGRERERERERETRREKEKEKEVYPRQPSKKIPTTQVIPSLTPVAKSLKM